MYFFLISIDNLHLSNFHVEKGVYQNFGGEDEEDCPLEFVVSPIILLFGRLEIAVPNNT